MIDAVKLLGSLLQQGAAPAAQDRLHSAVQRPLWRGQQERHISIASNYSRA